MVPRPSNTPNPPRTGDSDFESSACICVSLRLIRFSMLLVAHERVVAADVRALHLRRIAVDEGAAVHRVPEAAHFVLELEQRFAVLRIDDVLETILVRV